MMIFFNIYDYSTILLFKNYFIKINYKVLFNVSLTCKTPSNDSAAVTALTESPNTSGAKLRPPSGYTTKGVLLICARKSLQKMSLYYIYILTYRGAN